MLMTLDYNSAINYQYHDLEKSKRNFDWHFAAEWITRRFIPKLINKLNGLLLSQLLSTKGVLSELRGNIYDLQDKDLSKHIEKLNNFLNLTISFKNEIDKLIEQNEQENYPNLVIAQNILDEIIEHLFAIIRIFQKCTLDSPVETTKLAKDLSRISVNSLEKALYGN